MKILILLGKGGAGKTTVGSNLAVVAANDGLKVGLIDADPQRSLSGWRLARGAADIPVQACWVNELPEKIALARAAKLDVLIIDMPPAIAAHTLTAVGFADLVLLPMRPMFFDFVTTREWISRLHSAARPFGVVINAAPPRREGLDAPMVRDARNALLGLGVKPWRGQITHRHSIPLSAVSGRGVAEIEPTGPAASEYAELWHSIRRAIEIIRRMHHEKSQSNVA